MEADLFAWFVFALATLVVALVAAIEVALTAVDRTKIRAASEAGSSRAAVVEGLLHQSAQFWLTSMLIKTVGILVAGVALGHEFGPNVRLSMMVIGFLAAWLIVAAVQIIGRSLVTDNAENVALRLAPFAKGMMLILTPITFILYRAGVRISGEEPGDSDESLFMSDDGLRRLMQVDEESSTIQESEKAMIAGILEMDATVAREVMVPRIDMVTLPVESTLTAALDEIMACGHSRIPVYENSPDVIVGLLYAKDLLRCFRDNRPDTPIRDLLRPAYFAPASKKTNQLLRELQVQRIHMAMVVDEYGGIAGLVTIEDIMEEIFGEIQDEYDANEALLIQPIGDQAYIINARLDLDSLAKLLDIDLSDEDADTLGGLIYSRLGHVPVQGETVELQGWRLRVLSLDGRRIDQVRADRIQPPPAEETVDEPRSQLANRNSTFDPSRMAHS